MGGRAAFMHVRSRQQIKRVPAVVTDNGRELETGKDCILPGASQNAGKHYFVPLVEVRKRAYRSQVGLVLRREIAVEVAGGVECLAERVIPEEREVVAEALVDFQDGPVVKSRRYGRILVALKKEAVCKAGIAQAHVAHPRAPLPEGHSLAVRQEHALERRAGQIVDVNRNREPECVSVDAADGNGRATTDSAFDSKLSLLRIRVLIVRLAAENHAQRRGRSGLSNGVDERGKVGCRDAGCVARAGRRACNQPPVRSSGKKDLTDACRSKNVAGANSWRWSDPHSARQRHEYLRDLPEPIHIS